jgi:hypothetical protein
MVLPVELRLALAVLLCERTSRVVVERRRFVGVPARTQFGLDCFFGRLFGRFFLDLGVGFCLLLDFEAADVCLIRAANALPMPSTSASSDWEAAFTSSTAS